MQLTRRELSNAIFGAIAINGEGPKPADDKAKATAALVKRVRDQIAETVRTNFDDFLEEASIGDLFFMHETMMHYLGNSIGDDNNVPELALPAAFAEQLADGGVPCFVAVPEEFQEVVQQHANALAAQVGL